MTSVRSERARRREGLTLVELVITIVVLGIALPGVLLAVNATVKHSADPMLEHQAVAIAEAYLEEILAKSYADPDDDAVCGAAEASRDLYDDVCDYAGLDDAGARGQDDAAVSGLEDYRVRADVDTTAMLGALTGSANVVRVDLRVTHPTGVDLTLSGYRTSY